MITEFHDAMGYGTTRVETRGSHQAQKDSGQRDKLRLGKKTGRQPQEQGRPVPELCGRAEVRFRNKESIQEQRLIQAPNSRPDFISEFKQHVRSQGRQHQNKDSRARRWIRTQRSTKGKNTVKLTIKARLSPTFCYLKRTSENEGNSDPG